MGRIEYLVWCSVQCHKWLIRSLKTVRAVQRDTEKWLESWSHKFMSGRRVLGYWQTQLFFAVIAQKKKWSRWVFF